MSDRMKRTLVIETKIDRKTLDDSERLVKNFFDKYSDNKMRVETPDFRSILGPIRDIEKEINRVKENMKGMEGAISFDKDFLANIKAEFADISAIFTDGSIAKGFDEIMEKTKSFELKGVDLGGFLSSTKQAVKETTDALDMLGAIRKSYNGSKFISLEHLNITQLENALNLMQKLKVAQTDLDSFNGAPLSRQDLYSNTTTDSLSKYLEETRRNADELRQLNLDTLNELHERKSLMQDLQSMSIGGYTTDDIDYFKILAKEDKGQFDSSLADLRNYIEMRENLLQQLDNGSHLFKPGEIDSEVNMLKNNVSQAKSYLEELQHFNPKVADAPIGGNFDEVVSVLNEIKGSLQEISGVFQNTEVSIRGMTESGKASFEGLAETIKNVYDNLTQIQGLVDTISKKDFNITNITQTGDGGVSNLQAMTQQMAVVREQMEHLFSLYDQAGVTLQGLASKGESGLLFEYQRLLQDFDPNAIAKAVKGANSEMKLASVTAEMQDYIDKFIQLNELRNKYGLGEWKDTFVPTKQPVVKPTVQSQTQVAETPTVAQPQNTVATTNTEAQQMWQLKAAVDEVSNAIGRKNAGFIKEAEIVNTSVEAEKGKLKELSDAITTTVLPALNKIKEEWAKSLNLPEINTENIQTSLDNIYNKFVTLQENIGRLQFSLDPKVNMENVSVSGTATETEQAVDGESQSANGVVESFTDATDAKKQFTEANKQVAKSAEESAKAVKDEVETAKEAKETMKAVADDTTRPDDWDKEKKILDDYGEEPSAEQKTKTVTTDNAFKTVTESWSAIRDKDGNLTGDMQLNTVTIINDYKKRTEAITKENEKIETAVAYLQKFLTQFDNKTMGQGRMLNGYQELVKLVSKADPDSTDKFNIDDISKAEQMMSNLDAEYNKVVQNMRKGSSSMNPFVNAINSMGKMEDILRNIELQYQSLDKKPQGLGDSIVDLYRQFDNLSGETDIYKFAEGFGNLKVAINTVTEAIRQQRAEQNIAFNEDNLTQSVFVKGADMDLMLKKWQEQGVLTEDARKKANDLAEALWNITSKNDLSLWNKQWQALVKAMQLANIEAKNTAKASKEYANIFDSAEKEKASTLVDWSKIKGSYKVKAAKEDDGSPMQAFYLEQVEKVQARINALKKQATLTDEEKNALNRIELDTQERIAEIQQKRAATETNKKNFVPQDTKIQEKYEAGYLSDGLYDDWQKELAEYRNYMNGITEADETTIANKKQSLMQMYDALTKMSNASKSFFASGGEILPKWLTPEEMRETKKSLMDLYDTVATERFEGMKTSVTGVNDKLGKLNFTVDDGKGNLTQYTIALDRASGATKLLANNTKPVLTTIQQFGQSLKKDFTGIWHAIIGGSGVHAFVSYMREGIQVVRELDSALTELKKVTDETEETYDRFLDTAANTSTRIGRTITDMTNATAEFAKLGYNIDLASSMAEAALVYANVGDNVDVETGSQSIISTMKAFGVEANNTMSIVDKFNEIGNNFAITTKGIGDALQVSASAMAEAGNSLDETIALTTAANTIVQNPNTVGTALKTLSLRIRGMLDALLYSNIQAVYA